MPAPQLTMMAPQGQIEDWSTVLGPPYEVIDYLEPTRNRSAYVRDVIDEHRRPYDARANGGDCEDWAIAEYHARRARGDTDMYLVIGWEPSAGEHHAVLLAGGRYIDRTGVMSALFRPVTYIDEQQAYSVAVTP